MFDSPRPALQALPEGAHDALVTTYAQYATIVPKPQEGYNLTLAITLSKLPTEVRLPLPARARAASDGRARASLAALMRVPERPQSPSNLCYLHAQPGALDAELERVASVRSVVMGVRALLFLSAHSIMLRR